MLDVALLREIIPLLNRADAPPGVPGMDHVTDAERAAARSAIEDLLSARGMTWDGLLAEMIAAAAPLRERVRDLPRIPSPSDIRPGGEWLPLPFRDGSVGYSTVFPTGVAGYAVPVNRDGRQVWLGAFDNRPLRHQGEEVRYVCVMEAIWTIERLAQLMAQEHPNPNPKGGATILPFPRRSDDE